MQKLLVKYYFSTDSEKKNGINNLQFSLSIAETIETFKRDYYSIIYVEHRYFLLNLQLKWSSKLEINFV
jgi:hypothetical protein